MALSHVRPVKHVTGMDGDGNVLKLEERKEKLHLRHLQECFPEEELFVHVDVIALVDVHK